MVAPLYGGPDTGSYSQVTLQILVRNDGVRQYKPLLYFDSSAGKKNALIMGEAKNYDSQVKVIFNLKAYTNEDTMLQGIKHQYTYSSAYSM